MLLFSCQQPNNEVPKQEYSTPTIKGTISLPNGSNVNPSEIYVNGNLVLGGVNELLVDQCKK